MVEGVEDEELEVDEGEDLEDCNEGMGVVEVGLTVGPIKELDAREDVAVGGAKAKDEVLR